MDTEKRIRKLERNRQYYADNKAKVLEHKKKYYELNKDSISERKKKNYEDNKQQYKDSNKTYYLGNKETLCSKMKDRYYSNLDRVKEYNEINSERIKSSKKKWAKENPHVCSFYCSKRRAQIINAMPNWLTEYDIQKIRDIYKDCKELSISTGVKHHVDHIYPLFGKDSCGLHVPWNLRIITASENHSKGNKIIPPQQPCA